MRRAALPVLLAAVGGLLARPSTAQVSVDSLREELARTNEDSTRLKPLFKLANALSDQGDPEQGRAYLQQALALAGKLGDQKEVCFALGDIGNSYFYQGNSDSALASWGRAYVIALQRGDTAYAHALRLDQANAYLGMGRSGEAQHMYLEVLAWAEAHADTQNALNSLANLAVLYALQDKPDSTIRYYRRVLHEYGNAAPPFTRAAVLNNMGQAELDLGRMDSARATFTELMALSTQMGLGGMIASAHTGLGNVAMHAGDRFAAHDHFQQADSLHTAAGNADDAAVNSERLASLTREAVDAGDQAYLQRFFGGNSTRALAHAHNLLDSAIVVFQGVQDLDNLRGAYDAISEVERAQGDFRGAFAHYKLFKDISDTLLNAERDKKLTERAMQYAFDKKEAVTKAEQEKKDQRHRLVRNGIAGGLAFALLFLGVVWRQRDRISREKKRSDELLLNILPEEVAEELKDTGAAEARHFDTATILFTDFKGFTQLSEQVSPAELVEELNRCFKAFDALMDEHRIEKIKTIGDAYMAAGGLPDPQQGSPANVVRAALEMQAFMKAYKVEREAAGRPFFEMRVGIHSGPVVAGIVGVKKFQYDIWGDAVNTASRMESSGEVGQVNISEATYALVKDEPGLSFTSRGKVQAKGKGELGMYFVH